MTTFGWDASHYDGAITAAIAAHAKAAGIAFVTHKLSEGASYQETMAAQALTSFKSAGFLAIGGYHVVRSGAVSPQVSNVLAAATKFAPWWKDFPGWFFQVDLETWDYDNVPASTGIQFGEELAAQSERGVIMYASHGEYGDQLTAWKRPFWNANYPSALQADYRKIYAAIGGDTYAGWFPYSGQTPAIAQFSSRATIGDLTTCDANAFRGTLDELLALIHGGSDMTMTADDAQVLWYTKNLPNANPTETPATALLQAQQKAISAADSSAKAAAQSAANGGSLTAITARLDAQDQKLNLILAALQNGGGGSAPAGPVTLTPETIAAIATADADETARRQQS